MALNQNEKIQSNTVWLKHYNQQLRSLKNKRPQKLSAETEKLLAIKAQQGCQKSRQILIETHLSLVVTLAKKYLQYDGVTASDLIQDGNIGLLRAIEKFEPKKGYRLSTYATWWIKQALMQSFSEHDRLIRLPGHTITDLAKIKRGLAELERLKRCSSREITHYEIAEICKLTPKKVGALLPYLSKVHSVDHNDTSDSGSTSPTHGIESIASKEPQASECLEQQELYQFISYFVSTGLNEKEKKVISARYLYDIKSPSTSKTSLNALGAVFSTSRETIRQIEKTALQKVKHEILLQEMYD